MAELNEQRVELLGALSEAQQVELTRSVEIAQNNNQSLYTPDEINGFQQQRMALNYMGKPILDGGLTGSGDDKIFVFVYSSISTTTDTITLWKKAVDVGKHIITADVDHPRANIPIGINGKYFTTQTEITLTAGDIQAENGYTPSENKDLATKKYVDDSIPSVPVTDVKVNGSSVVEEGVALIPAIPDISGCEATANKVTALSSSSTDTEYPSAKCVYDIVGNVESILAELIGGAE